MTAELEFTTDIDDPEYLLALGTFIAWFACVETVLNSAVWHFSKLRAEPQIARAIFSALRVDAAMNHLTRLIEARRLKGGDIADLKLIMDHLGKIARARNDIVHLGAAGYGKLEVTNRQYAHVRSRRRRTIVSAKILDDMTVDLMDIFERLTIIADDVPSDHTVRQMRKIYPHFSGKPTWQYRPRVLMPRPRKHRGTLPKQKAPPKPF